MATKQNWAIGAQPEHASPTNRTRGGVSIVVLPGLGAFPDGQMGNDHLQTVANIRPVKNGFLDSHAGCGGERSSAAIGGRFDVMTGANGGAAQVAGAVGGEWR
jgi:hypothetical protein